MRETICLIAVLIITVFLSSDIMAQNPDCKVMLSDIQEQYTGDCKKGLANGKGTATGINRYIGQFKDGLPDGKGIYYYADSTYFEGSFQEGVREGKGELHLLGVDNSDSIQSGYWSGGKYVGNKYLTYVSNGLSLFDRFDVTASRRGSDVTFVVSTTSGTFNTSTGGSRGSGYTLTISSVTNLQAEPIRLVTTNTTTDKYTATYQIDKFPTVLMVMLSNGRSFQLELNKKASWKIDCYLNK